MRLRERRLVALVVPVLAVAAQVDERVAMEPLAEVDREIDDLRDGLGILAVDVEDRDLQHARDVGRSTSSSSASRGDVVKPTWLLTTTCTVPPTR